MNALRLAKALMLWFAAYGRWLTEPKHADKRCRHPRVGFATLIPPGWRDRKFSRLPFDDVQ